MNGISWRNLNKILKKTSLWNHNLWNDNELNYFLWFWNESFRHGVKETGLHDEKLDCYLSHAAPALTQLKIPAGLFIFMF